MEVLKGSLICSKLGINITNLTLHMGPELVGHIAIFGGCSRGLGRELLERLLRYVGVDEGEVLLEVEDGVSNGPLAEVLGREGGNVEDTLLMLILPDISNGDAP